MCESLTDQEIVKLARDKYLPVLNSIVTSNLSLPSSLMGGKVQVVWTSSQPAVLSDYGVIQEISGAEAVTVTAVLSRGNASSEKASASPCFRLTCRPTR